MLNRVQLQAESCHWLIHRYSPQPQIYMRNLCTSSVGNQSTLTLRTTRWSADLSIAVDSLISQRQRQRWRQSPVNHFSDTVCALTAGGMKEEEQNKKPGSGVHSSSRKCETNSHISTFLRSTTLYQHNNKRGVLSVESVAVSQIDDCNADKMSPNNGNVAERDSLKLSLSWHSTKCDTSKQN